jgi:hypothetical protein
MIAAMYGCSDCARLLIDAGADMKVKDGVSLVTVLLLFRHYSARSVYLRVNLSCTVT